MHLQKFYLTELSNITIIKKEFEYLKYKKKLIRVF
jgi:hypothetical protein